MIHTQGNKKGEPWAREVINAKYQMSQCENGKNQVQ